MLRHKNLKLHKWKKEAHGGVELQLFINNSNIFRFYLFAAYLLSSASLVTPFVSL